MPGPKSPKGRKPAQKAAPEPEPPPPEPVANEPPQPETTADKYAHYYSLSHDPVAATKCVAVHLDGDTCVCAPVRACVRMRTHAHMYANMCASMYACAHVERAGAPTCVTHARTHARLPVHNTGSSRPCWSCRTMRPTHAARHGWTSPPTRCSEYTGCVAPTEQAQGWGQCRCSIATGTQRSPLSASLPPRFARESSFGPLRVEALMAIAGSILEATIGAQRVMIAHNNAMCCAARSWLRLQVECGLRAMPPAAHSPCPPALPALQPLLPKRAPLACSWRLLLGGAGDLPGAAPGCNQPKARGRQRPLLP